YVLFNKAVYRSTNEGVNWNIVNATFTRYSQDGSKIVGVRNDLFIADTSGRVFKSSDLGVNWLEISDVNGAASNSVKGITTQRAKVNVTYQLKNCTLSNCADGVYNGPDGTSNTYYGSPSN